MCKLHTSRHLCVLCVTLEKVQDSFFFVYMANKSADALTQRADAINHKRWKQTTSTQCTASASHSTFSELYDLSSTWFIKNQNLRFCCAKWRLTVESSYVGYYLIFTDFNKSSCVVVDYCMLMYIFNMPFVWFVYMFECYLKTIDHHHRPLIAHRDDMDNQAQMNVCIPFHICCTITTTSKRLYRCQQVQINMQFQLLMQIS